MGDILVKHRKEIMAIFANYFIGEELDITAEKLTTLGISMHNFSFLKKTFNDVSFTITRLKLYDVGTYDIFWYEFTPKDIADEVNFTNSFFIKIIMLPLYLTCMGMYKNQWLILQDKLQHVVLQNNIRQENPKN